MVTTTLIESVTLIFMSVFIELNPLPELAETNVQTSLPNTKPGLETVFQLKQLSALQALVASFL